MRSPLDGFLSGMERYVRQAADEALKNLTRAAMGELGIPAELKDARPMRIKKPKTWTQTCNWLAGLGLANKYYPEEGPIKIASIKAVTVHAVDVDGRERNLFALMAPEWENPWVNPDGTGPRRKGR